MVVVVVTAWVVVVVVPGLEVADGGVVVAGVPLVGGSVAGRLAGGCELVVVDGVASDDDEVDVADVADDVVDVEPLDSEDELVVASDDEDPGATTTGSGIGGGGTPGGSVAFASLASTLTVRSCH